MRQLTRTAALSKVLILLFIFGFLICLDVDAQSGWKTDLDGRLKYEYKPGPGYTTPPKSPTTSQGTPMVNKTKLQLAEAKYDWTGYLYGNREKVLKNSRYGYIDKNGVEVIKLIYTDAEDFSEGLAAVKKDGKWGYINEYGSTTIEFMFSSAESFKNGKAQVTENGVRKEIDKNHKAESVNEIMSDPVLEYINGVATVQVNGKWGFKDKTGAIISPAIYEEAAYFRKGLAAVKLGGLWGFIDMQGKLVIPNIYTSYSYLTDNLLEVRKSTLTGLINFTGGTVVPFIYDDMFSTANDTLINVKLKGKWGCVNTKGKIIVPIKYDDGFFFVRGYSKIISNKKYGIIDENGKIVTPLIYDSIQRDETGNFGKLKGKTVEIKLPIIADAK